MGSLKSLLTLRNIIIVIGGLCICTLVFALIPGTDEVPAVEVADTDVPDTPVPNTPIPEPTEIQPPTNIPEPTSMPLPTQAPILLSGSGDSVVNVKKSDDPMLIHIIGNSVGAHFAVWNLDASGDSIDLLVNTTDPYDGVRALDFLVGEHTVRLEITATGPWEIEILPLGSARVLEVPGTISGDGDDLIRLSGLAADLAIIEGNAGSSHFAVFSYGSGGLNLLVNTTDPYSGTVILEDGVLYLEITAEGSWSIGITAN